MGSNYQLRTVMKCCLQTFQKPLATFFFFLIFVQKYKQIAHFEEMPLIFLGGGVLVQVYIIQTQQCWAVVNLLTWPLEGHSLPCWLLSCSWFLIFQPIRRSQMIRFIFHSWFSLPKKKKVKKKCFLAYFLKGQFDRLKYRIRGSNVDVFCITVRGKSLCVLCAGYIMVCFSVNSFYHGFLCTSILILIISWYMRYIYTYWCWFVCMTCIGTKEIHKCQMTEMVMLQAATTVLPSFRLPQQLVA